jgi:hypothetical protein
METIEKTARVRSKSTVPTLAWKYDVTPKPSRGLPLGPVEFIREQLGLARHYRNQLFQLEIERREAFDQLRKKHFPDLERLETEL